MESNIEDTVKKLMEKYGYYTDVELGEIPIFSDEMTEEEKKIIEHYIDNLIEGFKLATINEESIGEIINLGTDHEISIADLAHSIHKLSKSKSKLNIGKLSYRPTEIWRMAADSHKAHSLLGWKSQVSLEKGLVTTIEWYKKYLNVFNNPTSSLLTLCQIQAPKNG